MRGSNIKIYYSQLKKQMKEKSKGSGSKSLKSEKKKRIILEEVERQIHSYGGFLERKISERFHGIIGIAIRSVAKKLFSWIMRTGVINRFKKNYKFILDTCEELNERGKEIEDIVREKREGYLESNELYVRANKKAEKIKKLEKYLLEDFKVRLKIYSRILKADGESYEELVKNAFKEKEDLKKLVKEEFEIIERIIRLISSERDVLRIPSGMRGPLLKIFSVSAQIMKEKMLGDTDKIYKIEG